MTLRRPSLTLLSVLTLIAVTAMFTASCSSSRHSADTGAGTPVTANGATQKARDLAAVAATPWQTLSVPVSVKVRDSSLPKVSGTMTMVRDREIRISMRFLGMEVGALDVTQDSVFGYVKLNRVYVAESIPELLGGFPANVGNLQSILLGQLFTLGKDIPDMKDARIDPVSASAYTVTPPKAGGKLDYTFEVTLPDNLVRSLALSYGTHTATVSYSDFSNPADGPARPCGIDINAKVKGKALCAEIDINHNRLSIDDGTSPKPFAIPSGYRRITASALLKSLSKI